jgi:predicted CoA-binding protein
MDDWRANLIDDPEGIARIWRDTKRVAVLGMKTENQSGQPAFYVPDYLSRAGFDVVPVPVYYPEVTTILGRPVHRKVADVPGEVDMVVVFRRSSDVPPHVDDLLEKHPKVVWMQSGISHPDAARRLAEAGIQVVQDRCAMVEHRRYGR